MSLPKTFVTATTSMQLLKRLTFCAPKFFSGKEVSAFFSFSDGFPLSETSFFGIVS